MSGDAGPDRGGRTALDGPSRQALTRERIIEAAIDFVDRQGLTALTMRGLGKELGVEAMSLYRHVDGRDDLLEGIVDRLIAHLHPGPGAGELGPTDGWQAYLQWLALGVRSLACLPRWWRACRGRAVVGKPRPRSIPTGSPSW